MKNRVLVLVILTLIAALVMAASAYGYDELVTKLNCAVSGCHGRAGFSDFESWHLSHQLAPIGLACEACHPNNHTTTGPPSAPDATYSVADACGSCHPSATLVPIHSGGSVTTCAQCHRAVGSLYGVVTTSSGALAGATVTLAGVGSVQTYEDGSYMFRDIVPGDYSVNYSGAGCVAQTVASIAINAGASVRRDVVLERDAEPPVTTSDACAVYTAPASISLAAQDAGSGIAHTFYRIDGADAAEGTSVAVSGLGEHSLEYWSVDAAENEEVHHWVTFRIADEVQLALSSASRVTGDYAEQFDIAGTLRMLASGQGRPDSVVVLESSKDGELWVSTGEERLTGPSGTFTFTPRPTSKTFYRVRFEGTSTTVSTTSEEIIAIPRVRLIRLSSWGDLTVGRRYYSAGYIQPRHYASSGKLVVFAYKRRSDGSYPPLSKPTKSIADGAAYSYVSSTKTKYKVPVVLGSKGRWKLVVYHAADAKNAATYGAADYVRVK